jgi:hypothetical protein
MAHWLNIHGGAAPKDPRLQCMQRTVGHKAVRNAFGPFSFDGVALECVSCV